MNGREAHKLSQSQCFTQIAFQIQCTLAQECTATRCSISWKMLPLLSSPFFAPPTLKRIARSQVQNVGPAQFDDGGFNV